MVNRRDRSALGGRGAGDGVAIAKHAGESGRGLNLVGSGRMGGAPGYALQDASLSAGVFRALRESNLRLLESVPRERWVECYGVHEVRGRQTVEEFVRLEAAHDLNHLRQIDRILGRRM